jgi:2-keto-4-pentenoate hydratase/2-oxohepta-3-ene-1,7-dioic acid hydratase in catechol pathway
MKLVRYGEAGAEKPGVILEDGTTIDASGVVADYDEDFFSRGGLESLRDWLTQGARSAARVPEATRLGSPVARPSKMVYVGLNYTDHATETGLPIPTEPVLFLKATTALAGPNDDLLIPPGATKIDWEVEIAVVMRKRAKRIAESEALDHAAGFALHNDYSERSYQMERGGQWVKGKSCDTFAPLGPFVATVDEVPDFQNLGMWLTVNGQSMQKSSTANMIFSIPFIISYVSQFMTLLPGDVISTGTPAGVGLGRKPPVYLKPGDVVELGIDKLGRARQRVVQDR